MLPCRSFGLCAAVAGALVLTSAVLVQDKAKDTKPKPAAAEKMDPEAMAKMMALGSPGPDHKVLNDVVGKWNAHVKFWMDPSAPAGESEGTSECEWILGDRFIRESHKGTMMGMPFEGTGLQGYDNMKKKYVGTWADSMGTSIMVTEGTWDAAKKTLTSVGECPDPTMTKYVKCRMVTTITDKDSHKFEMFMPDEAGKESRCLEITYTRAK